MRIISFHGTFSLRLNFQSLTLLTDKIIHSLRLLCFWKSILDLLRFQVELENRMWEGEGEEGDEEKEEYMKTALEFMLEEQRKIQA